MKKTLSIALLLMVGAAFAASTMPTQTTIGPTSDVQALTIYCWEGTASALWANFAIRYDTETHDMWGYWFRQTGESGWIDGIGVPDPDVNNIVYGSGTFGGDDRGEWEGTFVLGSRCWGTVWNSAAVGEFHGRACD